ncbi:MAG: serine/threonine protein kinase, partial [Planctomycetia bacterium]
MPVSVDDFLELLSKSNLLPVDRLAEALAKLPPAVKSGDCEALARELVKLRVLTAYQAGCLYNGRTGGLFVGDYLLLDRIGQGGMGAVFRAMHRIMDRVVALKVLPARMMSSNNAVRRFQREVKVAAMLEHPNVVRAYDAGEHRGMHYLVMEYVNGRDLGQHVNEFGPVSIELSVDFMLQAATGLEYAHERGVVHRDVKPSNLLLDAKGRVKILDLGLARLSLTEGESNETDPLTQAGGGSAMGTVDYMAPEHAENTSLADARSDVYSLGCTLWFLLSGRSMHAGKTTVQRLLAHATQPSPPLTAARHDVPESLAAVFERMVAKDPGERFQSMGEVRTALQEVVAIEHWALQSHSGSGSSVDLGSSRVDLGASLNSKGGSSGTRRPDGAVSSGSSSTNMLDATPNENSGRSLWSKISDRAGDSLRAKSTAGGATTPVAVIPDSTRRPPDVVIPRKTGGRSRHLAIAAAVLAGFSLFGWSVSLFIGGGQSAGVDT